MFHPYAMVTGIFDAPLEGYKGPNGCSIISQEFYETDLSRGFVRGYAFQWREALVRSPPPWAGSEAARPLGPGAPASVRCPL